MLRPMSKKSALLPTTPTPCLTRDHRMMAPKDAGKYIGVSVDIVYEMIRDRQIPYVIKPGNGKRVQYLIDCMDLDAWVDRRKIGVAA